MSSRYCEGLVYMPRMQGKESRTDPKHTNICDACKWGTQEGVLNRAPPQRDPVPMSPTGPAITPAPRVADGKPWGTTEEDAITERDKAQARSTTIGTLSGSSRGVIPGMADARAPPKPDIPVIDDDEHDDSNTSSDSVSKGQTRRAPVRYADAGVGTEITQDWTMFDIGKVVRALITTNQATLQRVLRKLHVRWWHASEYASYNA